MLKELRKIVTFDEDIYSEGGKVANPILRIIGVAAVLSNPWKGQGFVEDLQPEIKRIAPVMGKALTDRLISMVGTGEKIEAYGKAALAGTSCEIEHASAIIHTLQFGNFYREAVGAKRGERARDVARFECASDAKTDSRCQCRRRAHTSALREATGAHIRPWK